jgi:hypothetical protein
MPYTRRDRLVMLFGAGRNESGDDFADEPLAPAMVCGKRAPQ